MHRDSNINGSSSDDVHGGNSEIGYAEKLSLGEYIGLYSKYGTGSLDKLEDKQELKMPKVDAKLRSCKIYWQLCKIWCSSRR